jgi:hypothetical protein
MNFGVAVLVFTHVYEAFSARNHGCGGERVLAGVGEQGDKACDEGKKYELMKGFLFHSVSRTQIAWS